MNSNAARLFAVLLLGSLATGCATATSNPETATRIESDPSGANCTLENKKGYSKQVVTPATVTLHRDLAPLFIACTAPGHASVREEFKMDGNAMVLGNILVGGLIGVAVDAASGAAEKFPDQISVLLDPSKFDSVADRDRWYEKKKARIEKQALAREMELDNTMRGCQHNSKDCTDIKEKWSSKNRLNSQGLKRFGQRRRSGRPAQSSKSKARKNVWFRPATTPGNRGPVRRRKSRNPNGRGYRWTARTSAWSRSSRYLGNPPVREMSICPESRQLH